MIDDYHPPVGRPMKYTQILAALEDDQLYTPSLIADLALEMGFRDRNPRVDEKLLRTRIRITMGRLTKNRQFPKMGDGQVQRRGQAPTPGWYGRRWKDTIADQSEIVL